MMGFSGDERRTGRERRELEDRRDAHEHQLGPVLRLLNSRPGNLVLLIICIASAVTFVRQFQDAMSRHEFVEWKTEDSLTRRINAQTRDGQFLELKNQIIELKVDVQQQHLRTDSIWHLLRRSVCRQRPEECP